MLSRKDRSVMVLILHFGALPKWFDIWLYTAKLNGGIDFHLFQDAVENFQDKNIFYHSLTLADFNELPLLKAEGYKLKHPYKFCDFRPLIAEIFPEIIAPYEYWGWGDLDVIYGDILSVVGESFNKFDYISTGWEGESGPLAFLRNSEQINSLWRLIPDINLKLNSEKCIALDEREFVSMLRDDFSCDIVFRECLSDLPAQWRDGKLRSLRTKKEYALYHFGGGLPHAREQITRKSVPIMRHLTQGGALRIGTIYWLSRKRGIAKSYFVSRMYEIRDLTNMVVRAKMWVQSLLDDPGGIR